METPTPPNMIYAVPPAKKAMPLPVKLLIAALIVIFSIAVLSVLANILLNIKSNSLTGEITTLQAKVSSLSTDISAMQSKLGSITSVDIATIKSDVSQLKDVTNVPDIKFSISTLDLSFYSGYIYEDDYYGKAIVTCSDSSSNYEALLKETLNSGGTLDVDKVHYYLIDIVNGSGIHYTHDWADKGTLMRPDYTLEVLGFIKLDAWSK